MKSTWRILLTLWSVFSQYSCQSWNNIFFKGFCSMSVLNINILAKNLPNCSGQCFLIHDTNTQIPCIILVKSFGACILTSCKHCCFLVTNETDPIMKSVKLIASSLKMAIKLFHFLLFFLLDFMYFSWNSDKPSSSVNFSWTSLLLLYSKYSNDLIFLFKSTSLWRAMVCIT